MRVLALAATLILGGCTFSLPVNLPGVQASQNADVSVPLSFGSAPAAAAPMPLVVCPPKVEYTLAQQGALAAAVGALPPDSAIIGVLTDYHNMRVADDLCLHPK